MTPVNELVQRYCSVDDEGRYIIPYIQYGGEVMFVVCVGHTPLAITEHMKEEFGGVVVRNWMQLASLHAPGYYLNEFEALTDWFDDRFNMKTVFEEV